MNSTHKDQRESRARWGALRDAYKAANESMAGLLYSECRRAIFEKLSVESARLSRLGDLDVELYDHCLRLMRAYKETIDLYERFHGDIHSSEVRQIIDGIVMVLVSRLREFEEVSGGNEGSNPIADEKQAIISKAFESLEAAIAKQFPATAQSSQCLQAGYEKATLLALYEAYRECTGLCRAQLNDLNNRKTVQLYIALMEDEWEILSTIIKIQVRALEQALENASLEPEALEKIAVHKVLSLLREAYQHFGRASTEVSAVFHRLEDTAEQWEADSYNSFEAYLLAGWEQADFRKKVEEAGLNEKNEQFAQFKSEIEQEAEALFGRLKLDYYKSVYSFRRMVSVEIMLAEEMATAFVKMRENWPDKWPTEQEGEGADILRGIAETIEIKVEGLRESISQMTGECNSLIESFANDKAVPGEAEIEAAKAEVWQLWLEEEEGFEEACLKLPIFTTRRQMHEKSSARCHESLEKKLTKFKREVLLYEVSTYEEIIFYSISRLRELKAEVFQHAVSLADNTLDHLAVLLKKNNIEVIRPNSHEAFNPKEHEVLMAESNPDFKKGEIVKLMNSGYRQNGVILLRANVIAAR